jgi:hypothetical protein
MKVCGGGIGVTGEGGGVHHQQVWQGGWASVHVAGMCMGVGVVCKCMRGQGSRRVAGRGI